MKFEPTATKYAIEIEMDDFVSLLDSESYRSKMAAFQPGNKTLCEKLAETVALDVNYNGHFGNAIYLTIESDDDTDANRTVISRVIEKHLAWCASLPSAPAKESE